MHALRTHFHPQSAIFDPSLAKAQLGTEPSRFRLCIESSSQSSTKEPIEIIDSIDCNGPESPSTVGILLQVGHELFKQLS